MFERWKLDYPLDSLEPFIDAKTMELHSEKHHQAYADKFNDALKETGWEDKPLEWIMQNVDVAQEDKRGLIKNHGGGLFNHNYFFSTLKKNNGATPSGKLAEIINSKWGDFEKFKAEFTAVSLGLFGSGWTWLALDENKENPHVHAHPLQENPLMHKHIPVLGLDLWEHAYYLKYQNRRAEYVEAFWNVVNWEKINESLG